MQKSKNNTKSNRKRARDHRPNLTGFWYLVASVFFINTVIKQGNFLQCVSHCLRMLKTVAGCNQTYIHLDYKKITLFWFLECAFKSISRMLWSRDTLKPFSTRILLAAKLPSLPYRFVLARGFKSQWSFRAYKKNSTTRKQDGGMAVNLSWFCFESVLKDTFEIVPQWLQPFRSSRVNFCGNSVRNVC